MLHGWSDAGLGIKELKSIEVKKSEQIIRMDCNKGMYKSRGDRIETNEEGVRRLDVGRTELTRSIKKQILFQVRHMKSDLGVPKVDEDPKFCPHWCECHLKQDSLVCSGESEKTAE